MSLGTNQLDEPRTALFARRAALLMAQGKTDGEVCDELHVSKGVLEVLKSSPLFKVSIEQYDDQIAKSGVESIAEDLRQDYPKNRDFITQVRDGLFDDQPKDRMQLRLQAAKMLLDKQVPNAQERSANETAAKLIIDGRMLGQCLRAMKNAGAIDVSAEEIENATGSTLLSIEAKTPEKFATEYEAAKEAEFANQTEE